MSQLLTVLASGVVTASLYLIFGLGLSIVYRTSGVLNFAHGAVGAIAGYTAYSLLERNVPYAVVALVAVLTGAAVSGGSYLLIIDRLSARSHELVGIMTLGLAIVIQSLLLWIYGGEPYALPQPVGSRTLVTIGDYNLQGSNVVAIGVAIGATVSLYFILYRLRIGLAIRAVSEGRITASTFGISGLMTQTLVWAMAGALAAVTALLVTPSNYLTPDFLTTYLIVAFVAVVLGGFERISGVVLGALVFGTAQSLIATYLTNELTRTVSFLTILLVLVFLPYGIFGSSLPRVPEPHLPRRATFRFGGALRSVSPFRRRRTVVPTTSIGLPTALAVLALVGAIFIALGPRLDTSTTLLIATMACFAIAAFGMDVIFGFSGLLSIGQSGFMLLGAYSAVLLQDRADFPYALAVATAAALAGVSGAIFGLPAARLRGVYMAVLTLAFALAVPEVLRFFDGLSGGDNGISAPLPAAIGMGADRNLNIYYYTVGLCAAVAALMLIVNRSFLGRSWKAVRDNAVAAEAAGVRVVQQRVLAFAIGSGLCGLAGAVLASVTGYLTPETFTVWDSIYLIVAIIVGGRASVLGAVLGAAFIIGTPYYASGVPAIPGIIFGIALALVILVRPQGIGSILSSTLSVLIGSVASFRRRRGWGGSSREPSGSAGTVTRKDAVE
ncbi:MAG: branched-chain amino acid transport system ATP-binding protein livH [Gaiellaceae bacterium]|jgi:ABC-type branched-subunit amino acid transport system permease subunit|nr:branched-chain amino acid transport system ATP-binding protein livH [Gaiellaceae bacterium]